MQDGTQFGQLYNSSNDFYIASALQDKDIKLVGNDGGSTITALTLDMSAAGAATFNSTIASGAITSSGVITANDYIDLNNDGNRGKIGYDSNHVYIASTSGSGSIIFKNNVGSGDGPQTGGDTLLTIADGGASTFAGVVTANAGVVVDTITIDAGQIDQSSGDLTLDVAGDIILDADGTQIILKDGGTEFAQFLTSATPDHLYIRSMIQDKDIILSGNDGGSFINALTLDMSDGGKAIFNGGATFASDVVITLAGNSDNLTLTTTDADATQGPNLRHYRNSSSPANDDQVGRQDYEGRNNNSQDVVYARTGTQIKDVTDGSEDGRFFINTMVAGTFIQSYRYAANRNCI